MNTTKKIFDVQNLLIKEHLDGWLFYDFRRTNDLACQFLEIPNERLLTRRFFYWLPAQGTPIKIVHQIEDQALKHLPGDTLCYKTWQDLENALETILKKNLKICMEYSPRNAIPYISKVDAGTMDVVKGFGVEVVSSGNLLQTYTNIWDESQLKSHLKAAEILDSTVAAAWELIRDSFRYKRKITEYDVQQFILQQFIVNECITQDLPICAVNAHSADPHYSPNKENSSEIKASDFILIDLWCKLNTSHAVYADITRVGVALPTPTIKQKKIFDIVKKARDEATNFVRNRFANNVFVMGFEIDDVSRNVIKEAGFSDNFIHRTGHNIDRLDHGPGAHIDNFETQDTRRILPGTCFSIEPGIYLPGEFGVRLEYDVYVSLEGIITVTGGIQDEIVTLV